MKAAKIVKKNVSNLDQSLENALSVQVFNYQNNDDADIEVIGAVEQPGFYDIKKYKNLEDLISNLRFVNVYPWLGVLEQFDSNQLIMSSVLFSLNDPSTYKDVELLPNSKVHFIDIKAVLSQDEELFDVRDITKNIIKDYELRLNHKETTFTLPVFGKYSVVSFVDFLGLDMSDVDTVATYISPIEEIVINNDYKNMQFNAKKYNTLSFRSPSNNLITVSISGAIEFPGTYTLSNDSKVEDLYKLIGSFESQAYLDGIILTRELIRERQLKSLQKIRNDLNEVYLTRNQNGQDIADITILQSLSEDIEPENLGRLAGNFSPKSKASVNTTLLDGDSIIVPMIPNAINVLGEVLNPIALEFSKNASLSFAIDSAGGFKQFADKKRVYVITASGVVKKANRNIFARNIDLQPGDTIVVPRKILTNNPGIDVLAPITQILSDLAFSAAAIDSLSNN